MIQKIKPGMYVTLKKERLKELEYPFDKLDARYNMTYNTAYLVLDTTSLDIILLNPNTNDINNESFWEYNDVERIVSKEDYPEYFIWK